MKKLIYLEDAIDAAIEAADDWDGGCNKERDRFIRDALEELPPAQPEIIRCKDCNWFGKAGCAVEIVDDSDKPTEDDFCSFAERRTDEQT